MKSNIERLGGAINVQSTSGVGTTFTFRIPLTLAIVQALVVETAGDCYVVPQSRIVELIRLQGEQADALLNASSGVPDFRFRGRLLPVVHLRDLLQLEAVDRDQPSPDITLLVLKVNDRHYALVVDRVIDNQEVVIKPLWQPLRTIPCYAGATQLADGTVALILDPVGLAKRAGLVPDRHEPVPDAVEIETEAKENPRILFARLGDGERFALPTAGLKRIEEVAPSQIKRLHGQPMMEHDGVIVRVIDLGALLNRHCSRTGVTPEDSINPGTDTTHIAFYNLAGETAGLIVGPVVDIVRQSLEVRGKATRPHVQFTAMIDEQVVEFLDVEGIIRSVVALDLPDDQAVAAAGE